MSLLGIILLTSLISWTVWNFLGKIFGGPVYQAYNLGTDLTLYFIWICYGLKHLIWG